MRFGDFQRRAGAAGTGLFSVVKADRLLAVGMQRAGYRAGSRRPFQYGARFRSHLSRKTYVDYYLADAARIGTHYLGDAQASSCSCPMLRLPDRSARKPRPFRDCRSARRSESCCPTAHGSLRCEARPDRWFLRLPCLFRFFLGMPVSPRSRFRVEMLCAGTLDFRITRAPDDKDSATLLFSCHKPAFKLHAHAI